MGYTHYWRRPETIEKETFEKIVVDFKKCLPEINKHVDLANGHGEEKPKINENEVWFNGRTKCGHAEHELHITWPSSKAGGIAKPGEQAVSGQWFAGAELEKRMCGGDCSHETLYFPRYKKPSEWDKPENGLYFDFCKTAFKPYDLAVTAFLIIAKKHLGKNLKVSSDGEMQHWFDGQMLCQTILGYGLDFNLDTDDE